MGTYIDFHIYGRRTKTSPRRHLGGEWTLDAAKFQAEEYRRGGWKKVEIRERVVTNGRCLRSMTVPDPRGRWVVVYRETDVKAIVEAQREDAAEIYHQLTQAGRTVEQATVEALAILEKQGLTKEGAAKTLEEGVTAHLKPPSRQIARVK